MAKSKRASFPVVDRRFQLKYTAMIVSVAVAVALVLGYFLLSAYFEMNELIAVTESLGQEMNADSAKRVFYLTLIVLVVFVVGLAGIGLQITHRVCGPIYVMQLHLKSIAEGKIPSTRPLRKGDEFKGAFSSLNDALATLKSQDMADIELLTRMVANDTVEASLRERAKVILTQKRNRLSGMASSDASLT